MQKSIQSQGSALARLALYAPKAASKVNAKEDSLAKQHRVTEGKIFMQPSGGKDGKPLNFSYCYFGMNDSEGNFVAGFNMSNKAMLLAVHQGLLSQEFLSTFDAYANKYADKELIKSKEQSILLT